MVQIIIREMKETDINSIYSITCKSLDEKFEPTVFNYFMMQWPRGQLVAEDYMGNILGFASGSKLMGARAALMMFAVREEYRSLGVGSKLLDYFRRAAVVEGVSSISLEVRPTNQKAIKFYKKNGFVETELLPRFYNDGGDAIRMMGTVWSGFN